MEDIAQELSVNRNSNMFENKMPNQCVPSYDNSTKHQLVNEANEKQFPVRAPTLYPFEVVLPSLVLLEIVESESFIKLLVEIL